MFRVLRPSGQQKGTIAAVEFEGAPYDIDLSFFVGDLEPGLAQQVKYRPRSHS